MKTIGTAEFKTKCLSILNQMARDGKPVEIRKRGRPVARLVRVMPDGRFPQESLAGTVEVIGDIIAPTVRPSDWEAMRK